MEQGPSWEGNRSSVSQEILHILRNPKVHYRIYNCPPLSWASSIQSILPTSNFLKIYLNIILPSTFGSPKCHGHNSKTESKYTLLSYIVKKLTPSLPFNTLHTELNRICHLLVLSGAHHILHVSRIRLNHNCHLLALLGAHHILHVSRISVKSHLPSAGIIRSSPYSPR